MPQSFIMFYSFALWNASFLDSLKDDTLVHKTSFQGGNYPIDGPVMRRKTLGWEPTSGKMTPWERNNQGRHYQVPFGRKRENAEISIWKQLQVIQFALICLFRHVSEKVIIFASKDFSCIQKYLERFNHERQHSCRVVYIFIQKIDRKIERLLNEITAAE